MKTIIVPVDFSDESINGLKMAILFSQKIQVNIQLVYVLQKTGETEKPAIEAEQRAENNLKEIIREFAPKLQHDSQIEYIIRKGRIFQEIVSQAALYPESIIAASTHGASGFQEFFIGSNTFKIISATEKPVITLRKNGCPDHIGLIILPIDLSVDSRQKVPFTTELAAFLGASIHVVGIQTSKGASDIRKIRSYVSQVAGYVEGKVPCETNEVSGDNVAEMVINYAHTVKADLISITTEQSPGISLIIGNTAHQILNKADIPVLCLTPKNIRKSGTFASMGG